MHIIYTQEGGDKGYRYLHVDRKVPDHLRYEKGNPPPIDNAPMISMSSSLQAAIFPHSVSVPSAHFSSSFPCLPPCPPATPDFGPAVFFLAGHVGGKSGTALHKYFSEGTGGPGGFYPLPNFLPRGLPPAPPIGGDVTLPLSPNWSGHCPMIMKYP